LVDEDILYLDKGIIISKITYYLSRQIKYDYLVERGDYMEYLKGNYMSVTEAAEALGITSIRVQQLCQTGRLQAIKFARDWMIPEEAITMHVPAKRGAKPRKERLEAELADVRAAVSETRRAEGE
jgi:excisionase family DNA binding protein